MPFYSLLLRERKKIILWNLGGFLSSWMEDNNLLKTNFVVNSFDCYRLVCCLVLFEMLLLPSRFAWNWKNPGDDTDCGAYPFLIFRPFVFAATNFVFPDWEWAMRQRLPLAECMCKNLLGYFWIQFVHWAIWYSFLGLALRARVVIEITKHCMVSLQYIEVSMNRFYSFHIRLSDTK